jgi:tRNA A-37 threonylcarbamoyl transferase component Bud32
MGAAYLAEHEALSHVKCVIKLVLVEMLHHPMIISRYHNEARALAVLKHDGIVKLHGLGVLDDGQLYLRLEYVEGKSLDRYLTDHGGRLPLRKAVYFIFQLCSALQHAHDRGVIHRDLKPDNLMVEIDPQGAHVKERIKILDFGIAKVVSSTVDMTGSGIQMGTPTYMAPEQVTNAAGVDGRADIFSLGQILVKIVTGKLPWGSADNSVEIYHRQRTQAPAWPPEDLMPREVAEVVYRALSLNPEDRPPAKEFAIELAAKIPAERGEESGTEILRQVAPEWVKSTPPHVATLPHPVAADPAAALVESVRAADGPGRGGLLPLNVATLSPKDPPPGPVKDITAHASPRALATPAAPAVGAAARSPGVALSSPAMPMTPVVPPFVPAARELSWHPPTPVLAALPTGLVSQKFSAQEPPPELCEPQVEVASEIDMAAGTPGPLPYAHADLPAVLVSNTFSGLTSQASVPSTQSPSRPEPTPMVVLPGPSRPISRRKLISAGAAALVLLAAMSFAIVRRGSHVTIGDSDGSLGSGRRAGSALSVTSAAMDAGTATPEARFQVAASPPYLDASLPLPTVDPDASVPQPWTQSHGAGRLPPLPDAGVPASPVGQPQTPATTRTPSAPAPPTSATPTSSKANGELVIIVTPPSDLWLNGKPVAQGTPYREQVPAGRYRVRIANDDVPKSENLTVTVEPHKTTTIERKW